MRRLDGGDKVSGDALHHCGGFLKRSWRSNDIMWGRLDGLCQLVETLLSPLRLLEVMKSDLKDSLLARLSDQDYLGKVLPSAAPEEREAIAHILRRMLAEELPRYEPDKHNECIHQFKQKFEFDCLLDGCKHLNDFLREE